MWTGLNFESTKKCERLRCSLFGGFVPGIICWISTAVKKFFYEQKAKLCTRHQALCFECKCVVWVFWRQRRRRKECNKIVYFSFFFTKLCVWVVDGEDFLKKFCRGNLRRKVVVWFGFWVLKWNIFRGDKFFV